MNDLSHTAKTREPAAGLSKTDPYNTESMTREVRLGLVMYGGVSLAIYINGVAREFFRAVQGQGVYRLIKTLIDSDVVVDVISGTSAGGINGILLAYALCNRRDFAATAELWRRHSGIKDLLRSPTDEGASSSILDSENAFKPHIEEAFRKMGELQLTEHDLPSTFDELDLFITATDVDGRRYTQFDDAGHPIDIKDHRAVFVLKHRKNRKEQFKTERNGSATIEALGKLCRMTSCFPAAFAPVRVTYPANGEKNADALIREWGRLGRETIFLDGGVLDNKPFTYTIKAIFSRLATKDVDRKLFFIEPDPEAFSAVEQATEPNVVQAVLASLVGIPGYESIADDLRLLAERNSKLAQYKRLVLDLEENPPAIGAGTAELYRRSRLIALSERVLEGLFKSHGQPIQIKAAEEREMAACLIQAFDDMMTHQEADTAERLFQGYDVFFCLRRTFRVIYLIHELIHSENHKRLRPNLTQDYDRYQQLRAVLNRQVMLYEIIKTGIERLLDDVDFPWWHCSEPELWGLIQKCLHILLDAKQFTVEDKLNGTRTQLLPDTYRPSSDWLPDDTLTRINEQLKRRVVLIDRALRDNTLDNAYDPNAESLLYFAAKLEREILSAHIPDSRDPVARAYLEFESLDALLFPLEMVGGLQEKDLIDTIRISPKDATRGFSENSLANKVSGDAVFHFGGFFKRSWRSNDILWGRLDSLCQLTETLLARQRIRAIVENPAAREKLRSRLFYTRGKESAGFRESVAPALLFPNAGAATQNKCAQWLADLVSDDADDRASALAEDRFDSMISLIVEAAQLEILQEDMPHVITDAIDEQHEWNRFQVYRDKARKQSGVDHNLPQDGLLPWVFVPSSSSRDPFVSHLAGNVYAQKAMDLFNVNNGPAPAPRETPLGRFFRNRYHVGSETLMRDIPTVVLLETLATALLVLKNAILGVLPADSRGRIRGNLLYRATLDWPLRVFHALTVLARRAPGRRRSGTGWSDGAQHRRTGNGDHRSQAYFLSEPGFLFSLVLCVCGCADYRSLSNGTDCIVEK